MSKCLYIPKASLTLIYIHQESSDEDDISGRKPERLHHRVRSLKSDPTPDSSSHSFSEGRSKQKERYKKVIRLTSSQWSSLGLEEGENSVTFSVTTQYQVGLIAFFSQFLVT